MLPKEQSEIYDLKTIICVSQVSLSLSLSLGLALSD